MVLWPLSTSLKHCLIPPFSTNIHPSFTLSLFLSYCLCSALSLWLFPFPQPLLYPQFIHPLTSVHPAAHASIMEYTKPCILGITSTDFLSSRLLCPFMSSLHCVALFKNFHHAIRSFSSSIDISFCSSPPLCLPHSLSTVSYLLFEVVFLGGHIELL